MKKEKSVTSVVSTHILTSSIIFPFFGLLLGYFVLGFLGAKEKTLEYVIVRDLISMAFFFLGVKYSLSHINKKIDVKNPENSAKYSIIIFGLIIALMWILTFPHGLNVIVIGYNTLFFGTIFAIFFFLTKEYFARLHHQPATASKPAAGE